MSKPSVLKRCLQPLVRIFLRRGVSYREFVTVCKALFVESARSDFGIDGRPANNSRIAMLTGIDRKEVKRLVDTIDGGDSTRLVSAPSSDKMLDTLKNQNRLSRLLSAWHIDPVYTDKHGEAKMLVERANADQRTSFESLVKQYGGDVPYTAVKKECLNAKLITIEEATDGQHYVRALKRNFEPSHSSDDAIERMASVCHDVSSNLLHNLHLRNERDQPAVFERRAINTEIPKHLRQEFKALVDHEAQAFLVRIDHWLSQKEQESKNLQATQETTRLGIGIYAIDDAKGED